jgi:hypothetical protein
MIKRLLIFSFILVIITLFSACASADNAENSGGVKQEASNSEVSDTPTATDGAAEVSAESVSEIMRGDEMPPPDIGDYTGIVPRWYFQFDPEWSDLPYNDGTTKDTIRGWACGPATMAMAVSTLIDPNENPADAAKWSLEHGYYTAGIGRTKDEFFTSYGEKWGLGIRRLNSGDLRDMPVAEAKKYHDEAEDAVRAGNWAIVFLGKGPWTSEGHFVLWYGMDGDDVLIRDSNSKKAAKAKNKLSLMQETVIRYWIIEAPENQDE